MWIVELAPQQGAAWFNGLELASSRLHRRCDDQKTNRDPWFVSAM